ncbi:MAG: triose-phosphate isomerase [Desulfuromonadaceae bacterium]
MRKPFIAGNWKLHKTVTEALDLAGALKQEAAGVEDIDIVIAPVYTALAKTADLLTNSNIQVAAQNCYPAVSGAFTGEVSPALLKDAGCRYCIVGHSERRQLEGLKDISTQAMQNLVVAYEPVWAIGTGKTASDEQAEEAHCFIRGLLRGLYDEAVAEATRILYGGSVKPDNVDGLMAQKDIDGTLVGGASLKAADFARIIKFKRP